MIQLSRSAQHSILSLASALLVTVAISSAAERASAAPDACPNAAIRAEQHGELLPNCRALEMVSPAAKNGTAAFPVAFGDDGDSTIFRATGVFAGAPSARVFNYYAARRSASGWVTSSINLPSTQAPLQSNNFSLPYLPPDLSRALWIGHTDSEYAAGTGAFYSVVPGGTTSRIGSLDPVVPFPKTAFDPRGASADLGHVVFSVPLGQNLQLVGGEPMPQPGSPGGYNMWEAVGLGTAAPSYRFVARDEDGSPIGGGCGAYLGGLSNDASTGSTAQHAVSEDGRTIYFMARPAAPADNDCPPQEDAPTRIYARIDGAHTTHVSESRCDRVVPSPNPDGIAPCDPTDGDDLFQGASADGSRAFFTSPRQLTDSDTDVGGQDLYVYDAALPPGDRLAQASRGTDQPGATDGAGAGVQGVVRISDDGSRAYFVATGVLTTTPNANGDAASAGDDNLYVFERDAAHPAGRTSFIGVLDPGDVDPSGLVPNPHLWEQKDTDNPHHAYAVPRYGAAGPSTGGDGHVLVFETHASLSPDDQDDATDIYRYDDRDGTLDLISRAADGASPGTDDQDASLPSPGGTPQASPQAAQDGRSVTEDGSGIVFTTAEGLTPDDTNGVPDVYLSSDGRVGRVSIGTSTADSGVNALTASITPSGRDVFFTSSDRLLPWDVDKSADIYDARVDGGFPAPPIPPAPCAGDGCQGPTPPVGELPVAASITFSGPGDPAPPAPPAKAVSPKVSKPRTIRGTRGTLRITVSAKGRLRTSGSGLATSSRLLAKPGTYTVGATLSKRAAAILKRKHRLSTTVRVAFTPAGGPESSVLVRLTFRPATRSGTAKAHRRSAAVRASAGAGR